MRKRRKISIMKEQGYKIMPSKDNPTSDIDSGVKTSKLLSTLLGGLPDKKDQDAIFKANTPKKAPGSTSGK